MIVFYQLDKAKIQNKCDSAKNLFKKKTSDNKKGSPL